MPLAELSLLALINNRTVSLEGAAVLWTIAARRGSVVTASPPRLAGKSTLLHAVMDLYPPSTVVVPIDGEHARFDFLKTASPQQTALLVHEFSDHLPEYTWGENLRRVFQAVGSGYGVGATMHAASAEQALGQLIGEPNNVPLEQLGRLHAVAIIGVWWGPQGVVRRVVGLTLVHPPEQRGEAVALQTIAVFDRARDALALPKPEIAHEALARRLGGSAPAMAKELAERQRRLEARLRLGITDPDSTAQLASQPFPEL
jgi:hypothetical protein